MGEDGSSKVGEFKIGKRWRARKGREREPGVLRGRGQDNRQMETGEEGRWKQQAEGLNSRDNEGGKKPKVKERQMTEGRATRLVREDE